VVEITRIAWQNIVKEGLTRKIFWNKDLAHLGPGLSSCPPKNLRCKCARFHCSLSISRVKVGCHKECDLDDYLLYKSAIVAT